MWVPLCLWEYTFQTLETTFNRLIRLSFCSHYSPLSKIKQSSSGTENVSGPLKVVIYKQHPLIYSRLLVGDGDGGDGCIWKKKKKKKEPVLNDMQQAALQICSASEPSDHGFPRNPLLINIQHQSVWRQVLPGLCSRVHIYKHLQIPPDETKDSSVYFPWERLCRDRDETTFQPN